MAIKRVSSQKITSSSASIAISGSGSSVTISSYTVTDSSYNNLDDTAVATTGGYIKINGTGFTGAATVYINGSSVSNTYISTTEIRAVVPALAAGTYTIWVFVGSVGAAYASFVTSGFPSWTSSSYTSTSSIVSVQLLATGDGTLTYSLYSGTLPSGLSLSSTGLISGTVTEDSVTSDLVFLVNDSQNQTTQQTVSLTIVTFDPYWENTTGLLQGDTAPFISDASTNAFTVTPAGDVRPYNFNPYTPGYYSNYFASNYISVANNTALNLSSGVWTIELWFFWDGTSSGYKSFISKRVSSSVEYEIGLSNTLTNPAVYFYNGTLTTGGTVTSNVWHHLAAVYDATNTKIYLDGSLVVTYAGTAVTGTNTLQIGIDGSLTQAFPGYISNVRILKGTALYTTTFTPPTSPLTAITNTVLLTCQSNRFIDNSTNAFTVTPTSSPQIKSQHPFTPNSSYAAYGSGYFDGTADYLSLTKTGGLGSGNFTLEFWFNPSVSNGTTLVFNSRTSGTGSDGIDIYSDLKATTASAILMTASSLITLNAWTHVAFVRSGSTLTRWVNGVSDATSTISNNFSGTSFLIGGSNVGNVGYLTGYISNVRNTNTAVYTTAFTPPTSPLTAISGTSLLTLQTNLPHNNNTILDNSTNNFAVTRSGSPIQGTFSPYSGYYSSYFNGTTNYLSLSNNAAFRFGTGDFTIEWWWYLNEAFSASSGPGIGQKPSSGGNGWVIYRDSTIPTRINFRYANTDYSTTVTPTQGVWQHWALVRYSGTLTWYCNGVACGSTTGVTTNMTDDGTASMYVGYAQPWTYVNHNSYMSDVRVVKGTAVYTAAFTPPTTPLTAISGTSLLTCQSNRFIDNSTNAFTVTSVNNTSVKAFSPYNRSSEYSIASNGGSVYFNGSTDYLSVADNAAFAFGTGDFTIEVWIYPTATAVFPIVSKGVSASTGFAFALGTTNKLNFLITTGTSASPTIASTATILLNVWTHVVVVRSGTTVTMYINGVADGTGTYATNLTTASILYVGIARDVTTYGTGYLSNVRVIKGTALYTTTFTPPTAPVLPIQNTSLLIDGTSGAVIDGTMNGNIITSSDARVLNTQYKYGNATSLISGSLYFDGTGDYMSMPYVPTLYDWWQADFTIEAWIYPVSLATWQYIDGAQTNPTMVGNMTIAGLTNGWSFGPLANGTVKFYYYNGSAAQSKSSTATVTTATWSHIAMSKTSSGITIFVNGTASTTTAISGTPVSYSGTPLAIGRANSVTINGYVDDLRITRGYARYVANFTVPALAFKGK